MKPELLINVILTPSKNASGVGHGVGGKVGVGLGRDVAVGGTSLGVRVGGWKVGVGVAGMEVGLGYAATSAEVEAAGISSPAISMGVSWGKSAHELNPIMRHPANSNFCFQPRSLK